MFITICSLATNNLHSKREEKLVGLIVNGQWVDQWYDTKESKGEFVRQESRFRHQISTDPSSRYYAEKNRYHLYVSLACPWAHRTLLYRTILNLEKIIDVSVVNPISYPNGWTFENFKDVSNDTGLDIDFLRDLYLSIDHEFTGKVTVPTLWDKKTQTIVNNESSEIIRMLDGPFCELNGQRSGQMFGGYPLTEIDQMNGFVYKGLNNGVYRVGFATSQTAYDNSVKLLFQTLDKLEDILAQSDYLLGDRVCECDWRLFTTLVRFDTVYYYHFKCNLRKLESYKNISKYLYRLLDFPKVKATVFEDHIIDHYYLSHLRINPYGIIPVGLKKLLVNSNGKKI